MPSAVMPDVSALSPEKEACAARIRAPCQRGTPPPAVTTGCMWQNGRGHGFEPQAEAEERGSSRGGGRGAATTTRFESQRR
eukprot:2658769-Prymnesium_polylepis.1